MMVEMMQTRPPIFECLAPRWRPTGASLASVSAFGPLRDFQYLSILSLFSKLWAFIWWLALWPNSVLMLCITVRGRDYPSFMSL